jgi:hypothetical protein
VGSTKKDFIDTDETGFRTFKKTPEGQKLLDDTNLLMEDSKVGTHQNILHTANLKDELLPKRKTRGEKIKTRCFFAGPTHHLLCFRMLFMSFFSRLTELHEIIPIKVGMSCDAMGWNNLYAYMTTTGFFGFDADFTGFDSTISPLSMTIPIRIMQKIYDKLSTDPSEQREQLRTAREVIHSYIEGAHVLIGRYVIKLVGRMISGMPGTAPENSLILWTHFVVCWKQCMRENGHFSDATFLSFCQHAKLCIYGDDNDAIVHNDFKDIFTFEYVQQYFAKLGMVMSAANKIDNTSSVRHISELTFLKRDFKIKQNMCMGALPLDAIFKSIQWVREGSSYEFKGEWKKMGHPEQLEQNIVGCLPELARHGEEVYNQYVSKLRAEIKRNGFLFQPLMSWRDAMVTCGFSAISNSLQQ